MTTFSEKLERELMGESAVSRWLIAKGWTVLPAYEVEVGRGKGPRLFTGDGQLIAPDLLIFNERKVMWCEAKTKSSFTWHRKSASWQTGIDGRHWRDYVEVASRTPFPVWLLFLQRPGGMEKETPEGMRSPSWLYGNTIESLQGAIDHEFEDVGSGGMVYWRIDALQRIAGYEDFE